MACEDGILLLLLILSTPNFIVALQAQNWEYISDEKY